MAQGPAKKIGSDHGDLTGLADDDHTAYAKGQIGYAEITSDVPGFTSGTADVSGLSATVTVDGTRRVKITGFVESVQTSVSTDRGILHIREGSTTLQQYLVRYSGLNADIGLHAVIVLTPSNGSHTYKLSYQVVGSGTHSLDAGSDHPAFILVEDLGPA